MNQKHSEVISQKIQKLKFISYNYVHLINYYTNQINLASKQILTSFTKKESSQFQKLFFSKAVSFDGKNESDACNFFHQEYFENRKVFYIYLQTKYIEIVKNIKTVQNWQHLFNKNLLKQNNNFYKTQHKKKTNKWCIKKVCHINLGIFKIY